jgi:hypothetical protein
MRIESGRVYRKNRLFAHLLAHHHRLHQVCVKATHGNEDRFWCQIPFRNVRIDDRMKSHEDDVPNAFPYDE